MATRSISHPQQEYEPQYTHSNRNIHQFLSSKKLLGVRLDTTTYTRLLLHSTKIRSLYLVKLLHSLMIRTSYIPDTVMHNILLSLYCKCGDMFTARQLFDKMPVRDAVTWNTLIDGYCQMRSYDSALDAFRNAKICRIQPDQYSYAGALSAVTKLQHLKHGRIIHGLVVVNGLLNTSIIVNALMNMYSKLGTIHDVRLVFDRAKEVDESSWNLLAGAYEKTCWPEVAVEVLVQMHRSGVRINNFAICTALNACSASLYCEEIRRVIHACVVKVGLNLDLVVCSSMLSMYAKSGCLEEAEKIFESIPNPNEVVFDAMIACYCQLGNEISREFRIKSLKLYREMLRRRIKPSNYTLNSVLEACALTLEIQFGKQVHAHVIVNGLDNDGFFGSALISLYSNSGFLDDSLRYFSLVSKEDVFVWVIMVNAYIDNNHLEKALDLFKEFLSRGLNPNDLILSGLISGCSNTGLIRIGQEIHAYVIKSGLVSYTICCNSLIDMYSKIGEIGAAIRAFEEINCFDVSSWSSMILGYGVNANGKKALELLEEMKRLGFTMGGPVYLAILTACSHCGLVEDGIRFCQTMIKHHHLSPTVNDVVCMVDLLGHAGRLIEAEDFVMNSDFNSNPLVWHTLFHACRLNRDKKMAMKVGERLMELEPLNAAAYIILHNIYISMGKFSSAMKIRGLMREKGAVRETDVSWIETRRSVKIFTDESNSSLPPPYDSIYKKVHKLLLDTKEKSKGGENQIWELEFHTNKWEGNAVKFHGELMAVCIGLKDVPSFTLIRIVKNQRVCNDCHEVLKLLSDSENREILVRDPARLHKFSLGKCSCGDYW